MSIHRSIAKIIEELRNKILQVKQSREATREKLKRYHANSTAAKPTNDAALGSSKKHNKVN